ncbi:MAG: UDP-3-O-[3-hydroxymyristoyl] N-acetylglucosamine deacetylase [Deltaproteobacteria bacterium]|nr:MAG: UDP-3-O-[3-hydroxymyristoyl] N-acetylglucosamine deacetylase [Deltaproteobacteria bacterium]
MFVGMRIAYSFVEFFCITVQGLKMEFQKTLKKTIEINGTGLHSGQPVNLKIKSAGAGEGYIVRRVDLKPAVDIPVKVDNIVDTTLATVVGTKAATVSTVEHCFAALRALGVDNAIVEVDGPEFPILDGSAAPYVDKILDAGFSIQRSARRYLKVIKPIRVKDGDKFCILRPANGFSVTYSIDFDGSFPGAQNFFIEVTGESFVTELSRARTFGFLSDVEKLKSIGKARGASLENAVALHEGKVLNPEGLRMKGELVRHKILDAVGDIAFVGLPVEGHLIVHKGGHEMHRRLVEALLSRPDAWVVVSSADEKPLFTPIPREFGRVVAAHG